MELAACTVWRQIYCDAARRTTLRAAESAPVRLAQLFVPSIRQDALQLRKLLGVRRDHEVPRRRHRCAFARGL